MLNENFIKCLIREKERFNELEEKLIDPILLKDQKLLKKVTLEHSHLKPNFYAISEYLEKYEHFKQAQSILSEEREKELRELAKIELEDLEKFLTTKKREIELLLLPKNPNEGRNIFMEIRAGTGGEEAGLFVADLMRMYLRYAEKNQMKTEVISLNATELGGYKEVIINIMGDKAFTLLHQEGGAHRVQRIPSTESNGRIHTSAVTVVVLPEREESEIVINDSDLQIDVYRASGAGGQHVNKTESAIRITHKPSGVVITCQDERSQHKNKARAMSVLRSRLAEMQSAEEHQKENLLKREQIKSGDRSERIRTYNFPQGRITDHRIGFTAYNLLSFMDGEMNDLLEALLRNEQESLLESIGNQ